MKSVNLNNVFETKDAWENVACPICNKEKTVEHETDITFWEYPGIYSISRCKDCGIRFQNPRVKSKYVSMYYENQEYWGCDLKDLSSDYGYKKGKSKKYDYMFKEIDIKKKGRVLDVGCGTGLLLSIFKNHGWKVKGIDISERIVNYANKTFKINAEVGDVLSYEPGKKRFDLITITHVLEHVYDPVKNLKKVNRLLEKDGELILVIPNINSLGYKIFKEKWFQFQPGRHLYYYSPSTITTLLEKTDFSITGVVHNGWEDNYYSHFLSLKYKYSPKYEVNGDNPHDPRESLRKNPFYELKKAAASIFAGTLTIISFVTRQSDVITVYAKKNN